MKFRDSSLETYGKRSWSYTQHTFTCPTSAIELIEKDMKYVQS